VDRDDHVAQVGDQPVELGQEVRVLVGRRVADRVGDVDGGRALVERDLEHLGGERRLAARRVHRRELDVLAQRLGLRDRRAGQALDVFARGLQLVLDVDVRRRQERVDPRSLAVADRLPCTIDVGGVGASQAADDRAVDLAGDGLDRVEVAGRGDREPGLDDVHAQARELLGDLELLGRVERDARRLLAVAQRRVEQQDAVRVFGHKGHVVASPFSDGLVVLRLLRAGSRLLAAATRCYSP
jgi:hypothetical protein